MFILLNSILVCPKAKIYHNFIKAFHNDKLIIFIIVYFATVRYHLASTLHKKSTKLMGNFCNLLPFAIENFEPPMKGEMQQRFPTRRSSSSTRPNGSSSSIKTWLRPAYPALLKSRIFHCIENCFIHMNTTGLQ